MTGYETFGLYQSLKIHFSSKTYDYFKYNGKSSISVSAFETRKDKYFFYKLSRKYENKEHMRDFLVANFVDDDKCWVGNLLTDQAEVNYRNHQKVIQSLSYIFENDCHKVFGDLQDPNDALKVEDGEYPKLLVRTLQKDIEIESLCILGKLLNFFPMWNRKISDTIRWPDFEKKVVKYTPFIDYDEVKCLHILKKVIT